MVVPFNLFGTSDQHAPVKPMRSNLRFAAGRAAATIVATVPI
jgi:hypothetical protein